MCVHAKQHSPMRSFRKLNLILDCLPVLPSKGYLGQLGCASGKRRKSGLGTCDWQVVIVWTCETRLVPVTQNPYVRQLWVNR